jgi:hypothetical protein
VTDLVRVEPLIDVLTGEALEPTPENAARVLAAVAEMRDRLTTVSAEATFVLVEESRRLGTKTLHTSTGKVTISGGPGVEYDELALTAALREAGCPEERITEAVEEEISYKVRRNVLNQLAKANPAYAEAIRTAERETVKPLRASVR